jgi:hypothetical protein
LLPPFSPSVASPSSPSSLQIQEDGSKVRYLKKTGEVVPDRAFKQAAASAEAADSDSSSSSSSTATDAGTPPSSA